MKKNIIFIIVVFVIVLAITFIANTVSKPADTLPPIPNTSAAYSLDQVALHRDVQSCFTVVRGGVYDLTSWIDGHPGGKEAIVSMCGRDATADFEAMHGGQRRPEQELKSFLIGSLKN